MNICQLPHEIQLVFIQLCALGSLGSATGVQRERRERLWECSGSVGNGSGGAAGASGAHWESRWRYFHRKFPIPMSKLNRFPSKIKNFYVKVELHFKYSYTDAFPKRSRALLIRCRSAPGHSCCAPEALLGVPNALPKRSGAHNTEPRDFPFADSVPQWHRGRRAVT